MVSLLPALYIVVNMSTEYGRHLEAHAEEQALRQAIAFAEIQIRITESTRQLLTTLAALPSFHTTDYRHAEEVLKSVHAVNPDFLNFTMTDARGRVVASSLLEHGLDLSDRPHIRNALTERRFCTGEYVLGLIESTPSFAYSFPILDERGEPSLVLNAVFTLSSYEKLFKSFNLNADTFLGIVDRKGIRLYFYPPAATNPIGQAIKESVWRKIHEGPAIGSFIDTSMDGLERFFGYKKLTLAEDAEPYITVVYATPRSSVLGFSRGIARKNLAMLAAAALLSFALAVFLSYFLFVRRLSRIGAMVTHLQNGELDARIGLAGDRSDLGRIAEALDNMAQAVQKRDKDLVEEAFRLSHLLTEKEVLLKEVHHRVKNNLQMTLSLIRLQKSAEGSDALSLKSLESRISAMSLVHEMLYSSESLSEIDLSFYCTRLLDLLQNTFTVDKRIRVDFQGDAVSCSLEHALPFGLLLSELVTNAFKHAFKHNPDGTLTVRLRTEDDTARLCVADDGPGLPLDFSFDDRRGLGLQLVKALVGQLGGDISWKNEGGAGFCVRFPLSC